MRVDVAFACRDDRGEDVLERLAGELREVDGSGCPVVATVTLPGAIGATVRYRIHAGHLVRTLARADGGAASLADLAADGQPCAMADGDENPLLAPEEDSAPHWGAWTCEGRGRTLGRALSRAALVDGVLHWPAPEPAWAVNAMVEPSGDMIGVEGRPWILAHRNGHAATFPADGVAFDRFVTAHVERVGPGSLDVAGSISIPAGSAFVPTDMPVGTIGTQLLCWVGSWLKPMTGLLARDGSTVGIDLMGAFHARVKRERVEVDDDDLARKLVEAAAAMRRFAVDQTRMVQGGDPSWVTVMDRLPTLATILAEILDERVPPRVPAPGSGPRPTLSEALARCGDAEFRITGESRDRKPTPAEIDLLAAAAPPADRPAAGFGLIGGARIEGEGLRRLVGVLAAHEGAIADGDDAATVLWFSDVVAVLWLVAGELTIVCRATDAPPTLEGLAAAGGDRYLPGGGADLADPAVVAAFERARVDLVRASGRPLGQTCVRFEAGRGKSPPVAWASFEHLGEGLHGCADVPADEVEALDEAVAALARRAMPSLTRWRLADRRRGTNKQCPAYERLASSWCMGSSETRTWEAVERPASAILRLDEVVGRAAARRRVVAELAGFPEGCDAAARLRSVWGMGAAAEVVIGGGETPEADGARNGGGEP